MLGFFLTTSAQYNSAPTAESKSLASVSPTNTNLKETSKIAGVTAASSDSYNSLYTKVEGVSGRQNSLPILNQPADFIVCDDSDESIDGVASFDLTSIDSEVTTDTDIAVTYYTSQTDADNGTGALKSPHSSSGETIFIRAENTVTGLFDTTSFKLQVNILPLAVFDKQFKYSVAPNATIPNTIGIAPTNFIAADVTVNWYLDGNLISGSEGLTLNTVLQEGEYSAEIIFNATGCMNTITAFITLLQDSMFPQGISPGVSPGQNDNFDLSSFDVTQIKIFNRNGTLVYSKKNYTNEWQGQTNDGEELPVGTYFYTIQYEYEGSTKTHSAWVYINR